MKYFLVGTLARCSRFSRFAVRLLADGGLTAAVVIWLFHQLANDPITHIFRLARYKGNFAKWNYRRLALASHSVVHILPEADDGCRCCTHSHTLQQIETTRMSFLAAGNKHWTLAAGFTPHFSTNSNTPVTISDGICRFSYSGRLFADTNETD